MISLLFINQVLNLPFFPGVDILAEIFNENLSAEGKIANCKKIVQFLLKALIHNYWTEQERIQKRMFKIIFKTKKIQTKKHKYLYLFTC